MSLHTAICDLFGIEHPVFLAGMGGVAFAAVCAAVSEAGGFGPLGLVGFPPERIRKEMRAERARASKPFGVDLLAISAAPEVRGVGDPLEEVRGQLPGLDLSATAGAARATRSVLRRWSGTTSS